GSWNGAALVGSHASVYYSLYSRKLWENVVEVGSTYKVKDLAFCKVKKLDEILGAANFVAKVCYQVPGCSDIQQKVFAKVWIHAFSLYVKAVPIYYIYLPRPFHMSSGFVVIQLYVVQLQ
ncbi:hypothetical protein MKW98_029033, partial [Papaver atlanticum]